MRCKNCNHEEILVNKSGKWSWCRCLFCGFHTSSYLSLQETLEAWNSGEHYISENGNKLYHNGIECYR